MIKTKHIEAAREMRLWLMTVVLPVGYLFCAYGGADKAKELYSMVKAKIEKGTK